jgi:rare lipoprotein A
LKRVIRFISLATLMVVWAGCAAPPTPSGSEEARAERSPPSAPVAAPVPAAGIGGTAAEPAAPAATGPAAAGTRDPVQASDAVSVLEKGRASWYGKKFHGRRTASGERYDRNAFTAAHRTLPFGTRVRVRSVITGKEVVVRINDRGPFKRSRVIDLSQAAFNALGLQGRGVIQVELLPE